MPPPSVLSVQARMAAPPPYPSYTSIQDDAPVRQAPNERTSLQGAPQRSGKAAWYKIVAIFILVPSLVQFFFLGLNVVAVERQRADWQRSFERQKESWRQEQNEKERDLERQKDDWRNEEVQREDIRRQWAVEDLTMERKRQQWADEDDARDEDEKRRISAGLRWTEVVPTQRCLRFGTREFSSQLLNLPDYLSDSDKVQWCYNTEMMIHGKQIRSPSRCSVDYSDGQNDVYGHWTISTGNPSCETWWEDFRDEGCMAKGSGQRMIRAHLGNHLPPLDNWREMCATTAVDMYDQHFDRPDGCNVWEGKGVIGFWFLEDANC